MGNWLEKIKMAKTFIHPRSIVKSKNIGKGTYIGPFCFISERVIIGENCRIVGHSSIGRPAQWVGAPKDQGNPVIIKDGTEIREFVTVNAPVEDITEVGENCYLMANCHVGHDSVLEDEVVLVVGAALAGYTHIGRCCHLGLNASTHQYANLGAYSMVGANSFFKGTSPEGIIWAGMPAKPIKVNLHNIRKNVDPKYQKDIIKAARKFIARG
jgi:UDP-N-acetylglucosamine acyltransferase